MLVYLTRIPDCRQAGNLYLEFRKLLFYPLNYGANFSNNSLGTLILSPPERPNENILFPVSFGRAGIELRGQ